MKSSVTCLSRTAPTCPSAKIREGEGSDQPYTIYSFCVGTHVSCAIACVGCGLGQTQYDLDVGTGRVCLPASAFLSKLAWEATCHYHLMIPPLRKHAPATAPQLHWNYFMLCMRHTGCFRQIGVANAGLCCRGVFVEGLSEWVVRSPGEVYQLMARGQSLVSASQSACMPVSCVCACSPRCGLAILLVWRASLLWVQCLSSVRAASWGSACSPCCTCIGGKVHLCVRSNFLLVCRQRLCLCL